MPNISLYSAGQIGVNKDIPPDEMEPREWSDVRGVRFQDGKAIRSFGDSDVLGSPLAPPYWLMPAQSGSIAIWAYSGIGNSGNDSFTKILLHFDGPDASVVFTDSNAGGAAKVWTPIGNAQIDTADKVFGSGSGLFDGAGDAITTPDSAEFTLALLDFTIRARFKIAGADGAQLLMTGQVDAGVTAAGSSFYVERSTANKIRFLVSDGAGFTVLTSASNYQLAVNPGWHDLEINRTGGFLRMFIDGAVAAGPTAFAGTVPNSAAVFAVGRAGALVGAEWNGWIDEFALDVGIARHTAAFTPATEAFGLSTESMLYASDGTNHANITRQTAGVTLPYTVDDKNLWHGGALSQIPIITNGIDKPQMWINPSLANDFADLSNWPVGDRCELIKPFKQFLVSMVVSRGGVSYKNLVKWSHPAAPGAVPSSWDETDPTKLAGEVEILDELPGGIRDGLGLRDTFVIYKDNATWGMQFIGGNSVFRFFPIFLQSGILSRHCVSSLNNGASHLVATGDDFIIHDGQNAKSVLSKRMRRWIYNTLPDALSDYCFVTSKPGVNETWFCFPEAGGKFPTLAAVYNWMDDTTSIRALPNATSFMDIGPIAATSDPWDLDSGTWDTDTTSWDLALFSPHFFQFIGTVPNANKFQQIDDGVNYSAGYMERTGLALVGQDRMTSQIKADNDVMKLFSRIWPKATGGAFNVQLGGQEFMGAPVVWELQQLFTPGTDKYLDFTPINARFLAVRFDWQGLTATEISGYNFNVELLGEQ